MAICFVLSLFGIALFYLVDGGMGEEEMAKEGRKVPILI